MLLDAATLTERRRLQGHADEVRVIRFSPSGALLASGSDDRTAIVWDVATGERRELLPGHAPRCGVSASAPTATRCTPRPGRRCSRGTSTASRRFIPRRPLVEPAAPAAVGSGHALPTGDAVAYTGCLADGGPAPLQFLDVGTGRAGPLIDTGHRLLRLARVAAGRGPLRHRRR